VSIQGAPRKEKEIGRSTKSTATNNKSSAIKDPYHYYNGSVQRDWPDEKSQNRPAKK
jgi:hypothetical protein